MYETKIERFTLQLKDSRCVMDRPDRGSSDDSDSMRSSSSEERRAKIKNRRSTFNKSKVKVSIPLNPSRDGTTAVSKNPPQEPGRAV